MLKHVEEFRIYREHPILFAVEEYFDREGHEDFIALLRANVVFLYPQILAVSFTGFAPTMHTLFDAAPADDVPDDRSSPQAFPGQDSTAHGPSSVPVPRETYISFFHELVRGLENLNLRPIFVIDLRVQRFLDKSLLKEALTILESATQQIVVVTSSELKQQLLDDLQTDRIGAFLSAPELAGYLHELGAGNADAAELQLHSSVTLASLEEEFEHFELGKAARDKHAVALNLSDVRNISFFAMQQLVVLLHSASRRFGNIWSIPSANANVLRHLAQNRFFDVLHPVLGAHITPPEHSTSTQSLLELQNACGVYVFDRSLQSKIVDVADKYVATLRTNYQRYLDQHVSVTYEPRYSSRKSFITRRTYAQLIRIVTAELIENVVLHASGPGFFAALAKKNFLYLYIGDCGVGVRRGILRNYDVSDILDSDAKALQYLFQLENYRDKRKDGHSFNEGAGCGLRDTLHHIFLCRGKFICRTGDQIASFMNPVSRTTAPSLHKSNIHIDGTQFMIIIPLNEGAVRELPRGIADFLAWRD